MQVNALYTESPSHQPQ